MKANPESNDEAWRAAEQRLSWRSKAIAVIYWVLLMALLIFAAFQSPSSFSSSPMANALYWIFLAACAIGVINALGVLGHREELRRHRTLLDQRLTAIESGLEKLHDKIEQK